MWLRTSGRNHRPDVWCDRCYNLCGYSIPELSEPKSDRMMNYIDYITLNTSIDDRIVLRTPHSWYRLTPTKKVAIGVYFQNLLGLKVSSKLIGKYLPDQVERWGKMRFKGDAECVRSRWAHEAVRETHRDASFARVSPLKSSSNCGLTHW